MSLDSIRKVRAQTVEALMMELSQIVHTLAHWEEQYRAMDIQIQAEAESYARHTGQGLTIEALLEWQEKMAAQRAALQQVRARIDHEASLWQQTQGRLVEAQQDRTLLERVAEQRKTAVCRTMARREQGAADEVASRQVSGRGRGD